MDYSYFYLQYSTLQTSKQSALVLKFSSYYQYSNSGATTQIVRVCASSSPGTTSTNDNTMKESNKNPSKDNEIQYNTVQDIAKNDMHLYCNQCIVLYCIVLQYIYKTYAPQNSGLIQKIIANLLNRHNICQEHLLYDVQSSVK